MANLKDERTEASISYENIAFTCPFVGFWKHSESCNAKTQATDAQHSPDPHTVFDSVLRPHPTLRFPDYLHLSPLILSHCFKNLWHMVSFPICKMEILVVPAL